MKQTRGAIGNLINRYRAVLKKCHLLNTFGSLALASILVLGGASVSMATDMPINDVEGANGTYKGTTKDTLIFNAPAPETSHFDGVALGYGTIQVDKGTTVSVANLCTGWAGNATGGGIWGNTNQPITINVTGEGTLVAEHVNVTANQLITVSGNLRLVNISGGTTSEFVLDPNGKFIVKEGATLDVTAATKFETSKTNFQVEDGGILKIGGGATFTVQGDMGSADSATGSVVADNSTFYAEANDTAVGNINIKNLSVQNNGTVQAEGSISVKETVDKEDSVTVTVVVKNNGDKVIAYLNGKLADSFKLVSVDASKGTFDSDSGLWYIGPLGSGESVYLILTLEAINVGINNEEFVIFVNGTDFNKSSSVSIEVQDNKTDSNSTDVDTDDSNQSDDNQSDESIQFDEEIIGNDGSYNGYILNSNNNYSSVEKTGNPILLLLLVLLALPFVRRFKK